MTELLTSATEVFTWVFNGVGTVGQTVMDTPIALVGAVIGFAGFVVGIYKSVVS